MTSGHEKCPPNVSAIAFSFLVEGLLACLLSNARPDRSLLVVNDRIFDHFRSSKNYQDLYVLEAVPAVHLTILGASERTLGSGLSRL